MRAVVSFDAVVAGSIETFDEAAYQANVASLLQINASQALSCLISFRFA